MPELPEIEAIKRVIEPQIKGLAVAQITVNRPEVIAHPSSEKFCTRITGQFFTEIVRRGKFLILCLSSGDKVVLHLRMTGCLLVTPADYRKKSIPTLFSIYQTAGNCVSPIHAGLGVSGCCGREKQIHILGWRSWEENPLIPVFPGNTCLHAWKNERKLSRNACWIRVCLPGSETSMPTKFCLQPASTRPGPPTR